MATDIEFFTNNELIVELLKRHTFTGLIIMKHPNGDGQLFVNNMDKKEVLEELLRTASYITEAEQSEFHEF